MEPGALDPDKMSFEELLDRARDGCRLSLGELLERCRKYLLFQSRRQARGHLNPKAAPSDLVQDTLLEAVRDFPRFRGKSRKEFLGWIFSMLTNNLQNLRRAYGAGTKRELAGEVRLDLQQPQGPLKKRLVSHARSPSSVAIHKEEETAAHRVLAEMPESYRTILQLRMVQRLPFKVIAHRLGSTPQALRQVWRRAVRHLAAALQEQKS
jgi:RNA polymerase sigma-70 factor (ECF subfamily)